MRRMNTLLVLVALALTANLAQGASSNHTVHIRQGQWAIFDGTHTVCVNARHYGADCSVQYTSAKLSPPGPTKYHVGLRLDGLSIEKYLRDHELLWTRDLR